jgi:hypothetical protein
MDNTVGVPHTVLTQAQVDLLYDILARFDTAAHKSGLNYSIACGTALGAVLRGGLIPWDDDADLFVLSDHFYKQLPALVRNSEGQLIIKRYTRWSDGRGWYKVYHPAADYPSVDIYLLEHDALSNVWRPSDPEIKGRSKLYLDTDQIFIHNRVSFGSLSLPIFSHPIRFLDRYYGAQWRSVKNGDSRPSLPN